MNHKCFLIAATLFISCAAFAQIPPSGQPGQGSNPPAAAVPIDGGAIALVIAAGAYGYRKIKANKHKSVHG